MAIGIPGIGSGLDLSTVLDQMLAIERRPLDRNLAKQSNIDTQISAYGTIKSAVSSFKSALSALRYPTAFNPATATSSSSTVATATATGGAVASSYALVVTNLATAQKTASTVYTDGTTAIGGTGTMRIRVNDTTNYDIDITGSNNTLEGIRDAINNTADLDVTASVINEDDGSRLILTSDSTGTSNDFAVTFTSDSVGGLDDDDGLSKLFYMGAADTTAETVTTAVDAQVTIDGFDVTSTSNTISTAVSGLTIDLVAAGSSTLTVSRDDAAIKTSIEDFVDKYNALQSAITTARAGDLSNDSSLTFIRSGINNVLNTAASGVGDYSSLAEIGISRDRFGVMSIDSTVFDSVLSSNHEDVMALFTDNTEGFADRLYSYADDLLDTDGAIGSREASLADTKSYLQIAEASLQDRLDSVEARLVKQFAQLDATVSSLNSMSSYLTQQLATFNQ
ncbi:MAG: flagellar filament capping protein FliD [Candidatus Sedimenticola sp. (ex Thyasira tokunagai)]